MWSKRPSLHSDRVFRQLIYRIDRVSRMASRTSNPCKPTTLGGCSSATTLRVFAERLRCSEQFHQEVEAMLLIAQRERNEQLLRQVELQSENEQLRTMLSARRVPGSSVRGTPCKSMIRSHGVMSFAQKLASSGSRGEWKADDSDDNVYDWVCEISKLSDVGTAGWVLRYSSRFLASLSESEKAMVMGTEPVTFRADADANGSDADDGSYDGDAKTGWDGAVVAVLGLFDKGKTFVLNRLAEIDLPSGKKVSTRASHSSTSTWRARSSSCSTRRARTPP